MISFELLRLYFGAKIEVREVASSPWRVVYDGLRVGKAECDHFFDLSRRQLTGMCDDNDQRVLCTVTNSLIIITAWNPRGKEGQSAENAAASRALHSDLISAGFVDGESLFEARGLDTTPGSQYHEVGFALPHADRDFVVGLANKYDQLAIYEIKGRQLLVIDCDDGRIYQAPTR